MVGSAIVRNLEGRGCHLLTASRADLDLRRQADVEKWTIKNRPDAVIVAAATVGGIQANDSLPAKFIYDNLAIAMNIIDGAHQCGVEKLMFLGSACLYPRIAEQPMAEDALMTGALEPTNEWYAIAKIAGLKMSEAYRKQYGCDFISVQPTNTFGPGDNFDLATSHVISALLVKAHTAKMKGESTLEIWGSGNPKREFLFVDDLADALVYLLKNYSEPQHINVGSGIEMTIRKVAETVKQVVGFDGELVFDTSKPDGMPRRLLDSTRLENLGWRPSRSFMDGLRITYDWYLEHAAD